MTLSVTVQGNGPQLVLVHGWGVNSGVWQSVLPALSQRFRVTCVDLPGHGENSDTQMQPDIERVSEQLCEIAPPSAIWLGWSLGGLICLQTALRVPQRVRALILSNTTPRFTAAPDWSCAMAPQQLAAFAAELAEDFSGTVQRFLALQVMGDEHARDTLRELRASVLSRGEPDRNSLATGLGILRDSDLRDRLGHIDVPTLVLTGEYDRLTPPQAGAAMADDMPSAELHCFPRTAHAPFISRPRDFIRALDEFMYRTFPEQKLEHGD